jgi:hypothetical protein
MSDAELLEAAFRLRVAMEQALFAAKALEKAGEKTAAVDVALATDSLRRTAERVTARVAQLLGGRR